MNLFVLDEDPIIAAQNQCDKLVCKMIIESAQLLCTAFHLQGINAPYKKTHQNHPSAIWTRLSLGNFKWTLGHAEALAKEYTFRYSKIHKTTNVINWCKENLHLLHFDSKQQTEFAVAISPAQKCRQHPSFDSLPVVEKYRLYYNYDKAHFCKWTRRNTPHWFSPIPSIHENAIGV
jgi:hypothetical protein